jgi:hypothetical protein
MAKPLQLPNKEEILSAMEVSSLSVESARYLETRLTTIITEAKLLEPWSEVLEEVSNFAHYTEKLLYPGQPWFRQGRDADDPDFRKWHDIVANDAADKLKASWQGIDPNTIENVVIDFAISDEAQFLRGYSSGAGHDLDPDVVARYDALFIAYLEKENIESQDGVLYESTVDRHGNRVKVDPDKTRALIQNTEEGFKKYLDAKGLYVDIRQQQYPNTATSMVKEMPAEKGLREEPPQASTAETPVPDQGSSMAKY